MFALSASLPVAQGVAVWKCLSHAASTVLATSTDGRSRGQIRADTLVERIIGQAKPDQVPVEASLTLTPDTPTTATATGTTTTMAIAMMHVVVAVLLMVMVTNRPSSKGTVPSPPASPAT